MEDLAPPLKFVLALRVGLESGNSVSSTIQRYTKAHRDDFSQALERMLFDRNRGIENPDWINSMPRVYRRAIVRLIIRGLHGQPILTEVAAVEAELVAACDIDSESTLQRLPVITLILLLLIQFPAFLILLIGPLLGQLIKGLQ